jgi:hypothetical protein
MGSEIALNAGANPLGTTHSNFPADTAEIAARYGLAWGGNMRGRKDPMHFEYTGIKPEFAGGKDHPTADNAGFSRLSNNARFNLGNIRDYAHGGFKHFRTEWEAAAAIARTMQSYPARFGADTLRKIITKYAPPKENPTAVYIKHVSEWTGINPDEHLDLNNKTTLAKLVGAMARQEGTISKEKSSADRVERLLQHRAAFGMHGHGEHGKHGKHVSELTIRDNSGGLVTVIPH